METDVFTLLVTLPEKMECPDISPSAVLSVNILPDYESQSFKINLALPLVIDISDRRTVTAPETISEWSDPAYRDTLCAIILAAVATFVIICWALIIRSWTEKRELLYRSAWDTAEAAKGKLFASEKRFPLEEFAEQSNGIPLNDRTLRRLEVKDKIMKPKILSREMMDMLVRYSYALSELTEKYGATLDRLHGSVSEGKKFSWTPPTSRISTTGRTGLSIFQLWPYQLLSIGSVVLVMDHKGRLTKLPGIFDKMSSLRLPIMFAAAVFAIIGLIVYSVVNGVLDDNIGIWWILGGVGLFATLLTVQHHTPAVPKGMLRLFRSIAAPDCEDRPDDVRTLARALYELGLHVWIDCLKLVSGCNITQAIVEAVEKANTVVLFLSPAYLESQACMIELISAIRFPAKVHIHVLEWNKDVYGLVCTLIDHFGIPSQRLTAHPADNPNSIGDASLEPRRAEEVMKNGKGWLDLCAAFDAYAKDDSDPYDYLWWIQNASNHGGIPHNAPYPPGVSPWNLKQTIMLVESCNSENFTIANDIREAYNCVYDLQYYYYGRSYQMPKFTLAVFIAVFVLIYAFLSKLNFQRALNIRKPDRCVRPLLATSNLVKARVRKSDFDDAQWTDSLVPAVKVAVHGEGIVADNLRKFLRELGFLAPRYLFDEVGKIKGGQQSNDLLDENRRHSATQTSEVIVIGESTESSPFLPEDETACSRVVSQQASSESLPTGPVLAGGSAESSLLPPKSEKATSSREVSQQAALPAAKTGLDTVTLQDQSLQILALPFACIDVFVIHDRKFLEKIYQERNNLRMSQAVFVLAQRSRTNNSNNEVGKWLDSILYIQQSKESFARNIMENISLRITDALLEYGRALESASREESVPEEISSKVPVSQERSNNDESVNPRS
ncbi:hypothetical protein BJ742DRAFT_771019 [Cladochytrium replicatum]|nr:hypothetical protein BJ742DRAFT_771019 [Cladochytrium replicatum]